MSLHTSYWLCAAQRYRLWALAVRTDQDRAIYRNLADAAAEIAVQTSLAGGCTDPADIRKHAVLLRDAVRGREDSARVMELRQLAWKHEEWADVTEVAVKPAAAPQRARPIRP